MDLAKYGNNRMEYISSKQCNFGPRVDESNPHFVRAPGDKPKPKIKFKSELRGFVTSEDITNIMKVKAALYGPLNRKKYEFELQKNS